MNEDTFFRSTRLAVENLTHLRSSCYLLPNQSAHDGVTIYGSDFGVVDFRSEEQGHSTFLAFQGGRIQGGEAHWRLEFLDPEDMSFTIGKRSPVAHHQLRSTVRSYN